MKTFTIDEASRQFRTVARIAFGGEPVLLVGSDGQLMLQPVAETQGEIPIRPAGYFADCYSKADARKSNRLAAKGPRKIVL